MRQNKRELQKKIGYFFKNISYLNEALTHSSYSNEKKSINANHNNERLEFLGDSVLSIIISEYLFTKYKNFPEGELTKLRAKIVCESTLSDCSKKIELGKYMYFGKGEEMTGGRERTSILADAFEALIAAIYLDGGFEESKRFILNHMKNKIVDAVEGRVFLDYKTHLQELIQSNPINHISYEIIKEEGPDHCKIFHTRVKLNDEILGVGIGRSKKESEQEAAKMALEKVDFNEFK